MGKAAKCIGHRNSDFKSNIGKPYSFSGINESHPGIKKVGLPKEHRAELPLACTPFFQMQG